LHTQRHWPQSEGCHMAKKHKQRQLKKKEAALKFSPAPARSEEKAPHPIPQRNRHPAVERYLSLADVALGKKSHDRGKK
jgi:hypothetical protein